MKNNKGKFCIYDAKIFRQEGYCNSCEIYKVIIYGNS